MTLEVLPDELIRGLFKYLSSYEVFILRGLNTRWHTIVKFSFSDVVRGDMITEMDNLNYIYEKETTEKLMEAKVRYLISYSEIVKRYFNMLTLFNFRCEIIVNPDPELKLILLLTASLLCEDIMNWDDAQAFIESDIFIESMRRFSNSISLTPYRQLEDLVVLRSQLPALIDTESTLKLMLHSWLLGAFEYSILKHGIFSLQQRVDVASKKIRRLTANWPNKTSFIKKAYTVLKIAELPGVNFPYLDDSMLTRINFILESLYPQHQVLRFRAP